MTGFRSPAIAEYRIVFGWAHLRFHPVRDRERKPVGVAEKRPTMWTAGSAGINRHRVGDERALRERSSAPSRPRVMRAPSARRPRSVDRGSTGRPLSSEINRLGCRPYPQNGEGYMSGGVKREPSIDPAESKTPSMCGRPMHENREIPSISVRPLTGRNGQGRPVAERLACTSAGSQTSS